MKIQNLIKASKLMEEVDLSPEVAKNQIDVDLDEVRDSINSVLTQTLARKFVTPYVGLGRVNKVLAYYHMYALPQHIPAEHAPATPYMEGQHGVHVFDIDQFGHKVGMRNDGKVVTKTEHDYKLFFEYQMSDCGHFDIFCEIVNKEELEDLLDDVENEKDEGPEETRKEKLDEATDDQKAKVAKVMGEFKRKKLHSGSKEGPIVKNRKQAIAIALNQAGLKEKLDEAFESDKFWDAKAALQSASYSRKQKHKEAYNQANSMAHFFKGAADEHERNISKAAHSSIRDLENKELAKKDEAEKKARNADKWNAIASDKKSFKKTTKKLKKLIKISEEVAKQPSPSSVLKKPGYSSSAENQNSTVGRFGSERSTTQPVGYLATGAPKNTGPNVDSRPPQTKQRPIQGSTNIRPVLGQSNTQKIQPLSLASSVTPQRRAQIDARKKEIRRTGLLSPPGKPVKNTSTPPASQTTTPTATYRGAQETGMDAESQKLANREVAYVRQRPRADAARAEAAGRHVQAGVRIATADAAAAEAKKNKTTVVTVPSDARNVSSTLPPKTTTPPATYRSAQETGMSNISQTGISRLRARGGPPATYRSAQETGMSQTGTTAKVTPEPTPASSPAASSASSPTPRPSPTVDRDPDRTSTTPRGVEYTPRKATSSGENLKTDRGREQFWNRIADQGN